MNQGNITIAIVDDDKMFRVLVKKKLEDVRKRLPFSFSIKLFVSGRQFLKQKEEFDIVFMDIAMPEMSGLETAEQYRKYCPDGILIFFTAYEDYLKEGYKVNAFRYIGKQDNTQVFYEAVKSAVFLIQKRQKIQLQLMSGGETYVALDEILYIESESRYVTVHTVDRKEYFVRSKISELTDRLEKKGFYLVHRAYLVNMKYILACKCGRVEMITSVKVPISERRSMDFKMQLKEFFAWENE